MAGRKRRRKRQPDAVDLISDGLELGLVPVFDFDNEHSNPQYGYDYEGAFPWNVDTHLIDECECWDDEEE